MKQFCLTKIRFIILPVFALVSCNNKQTTNNMTNQKQIVEKYMDGFRSTDHAKILSCLNEEVIWEMPGFFYHEGHRVHTKNTEVRLMALRFAAGRSFLPRRARRARRARRLIRNT